MTFDKKTDLAMNALGLLSTMFLAGCSGWFFNEGKMFDAIGFAVFALLYGYMIWTSWWTRNE